MVVPAAGAIVVVPFPFSDLSQSKLRPAVALADAGRGDWILCQMTSNPYADPRALLLTNADLERGTLRGPGYARPGKLFTAHRDLLVSEIGLLTYERFAAIIDAVTRCLQGGLTGYQPNR